MLTRKSGEWRKRGLVELHTTDLCVIMSFGYVALEKCICLHSKWIKRVNLLVHWELLCTNGILLVWLPLRYVALDNRLLKIITFTHHISIFRRASWMTLCIENKKCSSLWNKYGVESDRKFIVITDEQNYTYICL